MKEHAKLVKQRVEQAKEENGESPVQKHVPEEPSVIVETIPTSIEMSEEFVKEAVPQSIFRAYDIRGIVDETLTENGVN